MPISDEVRKLARTATFATKSDGSDDITAQRNAAVAIQDLRNLPEQSTAQTPPEAPQPMPKLLAKDTAVFPKDRVEQEQRFLEAAKKEAHSIFEAVKGNEEDTVVNDIATVVRVLDGDTVELENGQRLRLSGIDTPETAKAFLGKKGDIGGEEAKQALKDILAKSDYRIGISYGVQTKDPYGRTLAHIYTKDGKNIQSMLISSGNAMTLPINPNVRLSNAYQKLKNKAKSAVPNSPVALQANTLPPTIGPGSFIPRLQQPKFPKHKVLKNQSKATDFPVNRLPGIPAGIENTERPQPELHDAVMADYKQYSLEETSMRLVEDILEDQDEDFQVMQKNLPSLLEKYKLPQTLGDDLLAAKNSDQMERWAEQTSTLLKNREWQEASTWQRALLVGTLGFFVSPINLLPGLAVLKVGARISMASKVIAKEIASAGLLKRAGILGTAAALEESIRTAPMVIQDLTYDYEDYTNNIALAYTFGAGIVIAGPVTAYVANKTLVPAGRLIKEGLSASADKMSESMLLRQIANIVGKTAQGTAHTARKHAFKKAWSDLNVNEEWHDAKLKAQRQIELKTAIKTINTAIADIKQVDPVKQHEAVLTLNSKLADVIETLDNTTPEVKQVVSQLRKDVNLAESRIDTKETLGKLTPSELIQVIDNNTKNVLNKLDSVNLPNISIAVASARDEAIAAIQLQAVRKGIHIQRRAALRKEVTKNAKVHIKKALQSVPFKKISVAIKAAKLTYVDFDKIPAAVENMLKLPKGSLKSLDEVTAAITTHIYKNTQLTAVRLTDTERTLRYAIQDFKTELQDKFHAPLGNSPQRPGQEQLTTALDALDELENQVSGVFDWMKLVQKETFADLNNLEPKWALLSKEYENAMGENRTAIHKIYDSISQKLISHQFGRLTRSFASDLVSTKVPLAEWQAMYIAELPPGTGGMIRRQETAAIIHAIWEEEHNQAINIAWREFIDAQVEPGFWNAPKRLHLRNGGPNDTPELKVLTRKLKIANSRRRLGKPSKETPSETAFLNKLEKVNNSLYDLQLEHNIDGITGDNRMSNYMRQTWHDGNLLSLVEDPNVGKSGVTQLLYKGMLGANPNADKVALKVYAEELVDSKLQAMQGRTIDSTKLRSDIGEGTLAATDRIIQSLTKAGKIKEALKVQELAESLDNGGPSYTFTRAVHMDLETTVTLNGKEYSVLELLNDDIVSDAQHYTREATGRAALSKASDGRLNSDQAIESLIAATAQQGQELGSFVNTKDLRNFYRQMLGLPIDGALPVDIRKIRDAVSLAGMGGLGESQIAEYGLAVNRGAAGLFGAFQVLQKEGAKAKQWLGLQISPKQQQNIEYLKELGEFMSLYEDMYLLARNNVHFDTRVPTSAVSAVSKVVHTATGGKYRPTLQHLQTKWTGYSAIRIMEEQTAMAGLMEDVAKIIRTGEGATTEARLNDIGLDINVVKHYMDNGTIQMDGKHIRSLNIRQWSAKDRLHLGVALKRHAGQVVQRNFAGESSALMMNPSVAFMMQFKSYPMLAAEKQMGRSMLMGDKEAAMGIVLNTASSALARYIRYYSLSLALPENERDSWLDRKFANDFKVDTAAYMGISGMLVNNSQLASDIYTGNTNGIDQIPVTNWATGYMDAVKSASNGTTLDMTAHDLGNIQRNAPIGTIGIVNSILGTIKTAMETDSDEAPIYKSHRGD